MGIEEIVLASHDITLRSGEKKTVTVIYFGVKGLLDESARHIAQMTLTWYLRSKISKLGLRTDQATPEALEKLCEDAEMHFKNTHEEHDWSESLKFEVS